MKHQILHALRRTPRVKGHLRYLPIFQLPRGTEIRFSTTVKPTPGEYEPRELNTSKEEYDVLRLPEAPMATQSMSAPSIAA